MDRQAMPAIVLVVACAAAYLHGAFELDGTLLASQYVKKALTLESLLKNTGFLLTYYGLVTKGELSLRLCSLLATSCSYSTNWLKWPDLNMAAVALQSGLLFRAGKLTWAVWRKTREITFTKREQNLYQTHFEPHGLSKREYFELLRAGAQWRHWGPTDHKELTREGLPVTEFILLVSGKCSVLSRGDAVASLGAGDLVGESSFARRIAAASESGSEALATATVVAHGEVELVAWPTHGLASHMAKSSQVKACLMTLIAAAQAAKLEKATKAVVESSRRFSGRYDDDDD